MAGLVAAHPWSAVVLLTGAAILCALAAVWFACSCRTEPRFFLESKSGAVAWRAPARSRPGEQDRVLALTRVCFWNAGRGILRNAGDGSFCFRAPGGVEFWSWRVAETNNPANRFDIGPARGGVLPVRFGYVGRGDGAVMEVLHSPGELEFTGNAAREELRPVLEPRPARAATLSQQPAPFWRRAIAAAIDAGLIVAAFVISVAIHRVLAGPSVNESGALAAYLGLLAIFAVTYGSMFSILEMDTIGTRKAGLRLVAIDGTPASPPERWLRLAGKMAGIAALGLGLLWSLRDPGRLPWHDRLSGTMPVPVQ